MAVIQEGCRPQCYSKSLVNSLLFPFSVSYILDYSPSSFSSSPVTVIVLIPLFCVCHALLISPFFYFLFYFPLFIFTLLFHNYGKEMREGSDVVGEGKWARKSFPACQTSPPLIKLLLYCLEKKWGKRKKRRKVFPISFMYSSCTSSLLFTNFYYFPFSTFSYSVPFLYLLPLLPFVLRLMYIVIYFLHLFLFLPLSLIFPFSQTPFFFFYSVFCFLPFLSYYSFTFSPSSCYQPFSHFSLTPCPCCSAFSF